MTREVVIVGAGFAGLAAAGPLARFARERRDVVVRVFDPNPYTTMVPALPDLAGGRYPDRYLVEPIDRLLAPPILFHRERVETVDFDRQEITSAQGTYPYDRLVVAAGSVTNFFGFDQHLEAAHTLDSLADANRIRREFKAYLDRAERPTAVIVGGGYTGLELACNLQYAGRAFTPPLRVCVVELKERILPGMPRWVHDYMDRRAARSGIERITGTSVESFDGRNVTLANGETLEDIFLCWATGTRFALSDLRGDCEQARDGRLEVDAGLRLPQHPEVFAAGDSAALRAKGSLLRKAVNFSIGSGHAAGENAARSLGGTEPKPFRPVDLGWVIPFCSVGIGKLFGKIRVRGRLPLSLHYVMCGVRNYNAQNRRFFFKTALRALRPAPGGPQG